MFAKLLQVAVDTVTLPVSVAADAITLGGALVDRDEPYTATKAKRIGRDVAGAVKTLAE